MRIDQLIYFIALVKAKSLTKASQKLFVTPQALHISIKRLEDELDCKLFIKNKNGFELSKVGKIFYISADKIIDEYYNGLKSINNIKKLPKEISGCIYIYANMVFQRKFLQDVIKSFHLKYPNIQVLLFESDTVGTYKKFNEKDVEDNIGKIGFLQIPRIKNKKNNQWTDTQQYNFIPLFDAEFYACAHSGMNFPQTESIKNLLKYPITFYASNENSLYFSENDITNPLLLMLSEWGKVNIYSSVNSMSLWSNTIENNNCIGFINSFLADNADESIKNLQLIKIREPLRTTLGFLVHKKRNKIINAFIKETELCSTFSKFGY